MGTQKGLPVSDNQQASHPCAACGGSGLVPRYFEGQQYMCPVCLGAGSISDKMPARDAVADADTLTSCLIAYGNAWKARALLNWTTWPLNSAVIDYYDAIHAARAAFRAVPGLRG